MKKILSILAFTAFLITSSINTQAQDLENLINGAMTMQENGKTDQLAGALGLLTNGLKKEVSGSTGDFKDKLLGSIGGVESLIPMATNGTLQKGALSKALNTVKLLMGANKLSGLLGGSLLGQGSKVANSLGLLKGGLGVLGDGPASKIGNILNKSSKKIGKLDSGGLFKGLRDKAVNKQLGSVLNLVKGAL